MVMVSDGKSRPQPMRLQLCENMLLLQKEEIVNSNITICHQEPPGDSRERIVKVIRQKIGGLGLSIKGGAENKLPILISRIFRDQADGTTCKASNQM
ncbi:gamma-1-syntrophin-like [Centruroides sculpturatus]|uniref:gamma-1-syntrophin-like n=1 Tax=Centruroides sculpturatus TaxID=218467 RepID=UPI000C6D4E32|nr:gamma-1-syntrophin-like [Centruroides sculpturatus]